MEEDWLARIYEGLESHGWLLREGDAVSGINGETAYATVHLTLFSPLTRDYNIKLANLEKSKKMLDYAVCAYVRFCNSDNWLSINCFIGNDGKVLVWK